MTFIFEGTHDALATYPYIYNKEKRVRKIRGWNFYCSSVHCYGWECGTRGKLMGTIKKRLGVFTKTPKTCVACGHYLYVELLYY